MSIEPPTEVIYDLDLSPGEIRIPEVGSSERQSLVQLEGTLENWEKMKRTLVSLRASNTPSLLLLRKETETREISELSYVFSYLRDWDQLVVHNILELCIDFIPEAFRPALRVEEKIELKWFKEWQQASCDPRIYKYPSLPWRSYIRKIVGENFQFTTKLLDFQLRGDEEAKGPCLREFLEAKKKVVCVFPKRWGKLQ